MIRSEEDFSPLAEALSIYEHEDRATYDCLINLAPLVIPGARIFEDKHLKSRYSFGIRFVDKNTEIMVASIQRVIRVYNPVVGNGARKLASVYESVTGKDFNVDLIAGIEGRVNSH